MEQYQKIDGVSNKKYCMAIAICNSDLNVKMLKLCYSFCSLVNDKSPMESYEAAQAIFPTLSRALQKYLRTTRQQPRYV